MISTDHSRYSVASALIKRLGLAPDLDGDGDGDSWSDRDDAVAAASETLADALLARHDGDVARSLVALDRARPRREPSIPATEMIAGPPPEYPTIPETIPAEALPPSAPPAAAGPSDRYRIEALHARGGLGEVHRAWDSALNRPVALKTLRVQRADNPTSRSKFLVEAEITGNLEHPGIVPVHDLGHSGDGRPFYAMRFIRGRTLTEAIADHHRDADVESGGAGQSLAFRDLLGRFIDACNAVAFAHSKGVIHRDLKPDNIMLGPFGETLVVDWGMAKAEGRADLAGEPSGEAPLELSGPGDTPTLPGSIFGTPRFMSPEQAAGQVDRVGPLSDIYGLGATLYALVTGRDPIEHADLQETLRRVRDGAISPPRDVNPSVPRPLDAICRKAMAVVPGDRHPSARALAGDVERWLADEPVSCYREPPWERLLRWVDRHRTEVIAAAAVLLAALAGVSAVTVVKHRDHRALQAAHREERSQRERADRLFDLAMDRLEEITDRLHDEPALRRPGLAPLNRSLLEPELRFYRRLTEALDDGSPLPRSRLLLLCRAFEDRAALARVAGRPDEALASIRRAGLLLDALAEQQPDDPRLRALRAQLEHASISIDSPSP